MNIDSYRYSTLHIVSHHIVYVLFLLRYGNKYILFYSVSDIETSKYMAITAKASNNTKHRLKFRLFL